MITDNGNANMMGWRPDVKKDKANVMHLLFTLDYCINKFCFKQSEMDMDDV